MTLIGREVVLLLAIFGHSTLGTQAETTHESSSRNLLSRRLFPVRGDYEIFQARTASCVFDVLHGSTYIAQAGTSIDAATRKCQMPTPIDGANQALCSVSITQLIESFSYAASFFSSVAIDCTDRANFKAACASSITALVGAIGDFAQAGSAMSYDCPGTKNHPPRRLEKKDNETVATMENITQTLEEARRLWSPIQNPVWTRYGAGGRSEVAVRNYKAELAFCGIYSAQAAFFLARAGININEAVHTCPVTSATAKAEDNAICGIDVSGVILSVVNVASFISGAVAQCQHGLNPAAGCTADVTKLVAAMAVVANAAQGIFVACVDEDTPAILASSTTPFPVAIPPRRLEEHATGGERPGVDHSPRPADIVV